MVFFVAAQWAGSLLDALHFLCFTDVFAGMDSDLDCIRVWSIPTTWRVETQPEEVELCEQNYCKMNDTNCTNKGSEAARSAGLVFRI